MKKRTRWRRVYNPVIGVRFFDGGDYALKQRQKEYIIMCEKCKELVMCPVGEKRKVEVDFSDKNQIVDAYGNKLFIKPWTMFVDKYPDGHNESGLYQDIYDENNVNYGGGLIITHCPFCGEEFA